MPFAISPQMRFKFSSISNLCTQSRYESVTSAQFYCTSLIREEGRPLHSQNRGTITLGEIQVTLNEILTPPGPSSESRITETSCCATGLSPTGRGDRLPNIIVHTLFTSTHPPFSRRAELRIVSAASGSKRKVVSNPEIFSVVNIILHLTESDPSPQPRFSLNLKFARCSSAITIRSGGVRKIQLTAKQNNVPTSTYHGQEIVGHHAGSQLLTVQS